MRAIDPQSDAPLEDDKLTAALRHLAASSPHGAPAEIGVGLTMAFRRHHARRRLVRRMSAVALAACIALVAGLLSIRSPHKAPRERAQEAASNVAAWPANAVSAPAAITRPARSSAKRVKARAAAVTASRREFLALPGYDPAVPSDELHVVRVQLPASALWQMGAPVSPDSGARRFMADFVVSQDGTPYAVRLVQ
jgi:hypothetical protein